MWDGGNEEGNGVDRYRAVVENLRKSGKVVESRGGDGGLLLRV